MLTKSDFKLFMDCPRHFWVKKQCEDEYHERITEQDQFTMQQGFEVEKVAKTLFPDGTYIPVTGDTGYVQTQAAIADGAKIIYQATVVAPCLPAGRDDLQARADILVRDGLSSEASAKEDDKWQLYEVKAV